MTRPLLSTGDKRLSAGCTCRVACKARPRDDACVRKDNELEGEMLYER
jgi:hypothetical protein